MAKRERSLKHHQTICPFKMNIFERPYYLNGKEIEKIPKDHHAIYDSENKRWNVIKDKTKEDLDDQIIKEFNITFKNNLNGSSMKLDYLTQRWYSDNDNRSGGYFKGTDRGLSDHLDLLMKQGHQIRDIYEKENTSDS